jgi:hypothetical protein
LVVNPVLPQDARSTKYEVSHNYLNNGYFAAVHGNSESSRRPILAGAAQGSLVGAVSFNIHINDIPSIQNDYN